MTREEAQNILTQWSRPWFNINSPPGVWTTLVARARAPDSLQAFRLHCFYALIEAAVARARRAVSTPSTQARFDPFSRLNQLRLAHWTDPVASSRSSTLRATTNVAYSGNSFRENHVMEATMNGPFVHVTINLDVPGAPLSGLKDYSANEVRDAQGTICFETFELAAAGTSPARGPNAPRR